jgi:hypothetical protein
LAFVLFGLPKYFDQRDATRVANGEQKQWFHVVESISDAEGAEGSLVKSWRFSGPFESEAACNSDISRQSATGVRATPGEIGDACEIAFPSDIATLEQYRQENVNEGGGTSSGDSGNSSDAPVSARTFHGYACTTDCSGHEAGYRWAEEKGITDPDDCPIDPHNSHSFTEGCWAEAGRDGP